MTLQILENKLGDAVSSLLKLARTSTWNNISNDCSFILSEIKNRDENILKQSRLITKGNNKKTALKLDEILPQLLTFYDNIFDINLFIHKASKKITIIDIRYYLKSSLSKEYLQAVQKNEPMLHCKILMPPYAYGTEKKFNINWQHIFFLNLMENILP